MAFSPAGNDWYLVNATPDVTTQLFRSASLHPQEGVRSMPFRGVLLTDAELDHTLGLLHLREGASWSLHASEGALHALRSGFDVLPSLARYADVEVHEVTLSAPVSFEEGDRVVHVRWLETDRDPPLHTGSEAELPGGGCALVLDDSVTGGRLVYAPGVAILSDELRAACADADAVLFDGTFWTGDELVSVSGSKRDAWAMGHVPVDGPSGSAAYLAELPATVKRYVHINNTNPLLDPSSPQRTRIRALGLDLAEDGEEWTL